MMESVKDMKFTFNPKIDVMEAFEDKDGKWLKIGGTALVEGVSRNRNNYTIENLKENDGREFKWLFGHPREAEPHIVGKGVLNLNGESLVHEGRIRNTANHPDVVESVRDGFLGPSIHANAKLVTYDKKNETYNLKGLEIEGVGLVAFQGVKSASIDYAIAESFKERTELKESSDEDDKNKDKEGINMPEEPKEEPQEETPKEEPKVTPEETPEPEGNTEESVSVEDFKAVKEELDVLKKSQKEKIVESILEMNKDFKKEDLMKESEDALKLREEYEKKLSTQTNESSVVEDDETKKDEVMEAKDGSASFTDEAYESYNKELRDRVR